MSVSQKKLNKKHQHVKQAFKFQGLEKPTEDPKMKVLKKSLDVALDQRYTEMERWKHRPSTPASMLAADPRSWNSGFLPEEKVPIDPIVCIPGTVWPIVPEPVEEQARNIWENRRPAPVFLPEPSATGAAHGAGASAPSSSTPARGAAAEALV
eukprot:CAMPEP_0204129294 /NCGR_PEP_ID=MMETSP0361-20130328/12690_1 /ASSEMBLY_ACC=CAM_ASM_000343 /TAXON_ID=268821 /ORGANISM="Scrippsiella Hangoei, Strain SHTV-5" /LENGTH=152 /DNA_ID=CAMNT_0051081677 /DNA_START=39 /DNA_END=493 /DNA_ORIENTATION=+